MKAIITKYLGPTNTRPARIKASAEGVKPITYNCGLLERIQDERPELTLLGTHQIAARQFAITHDWSINLASGQTSPNSFAHCFIPTFEPMTYSESISRLTEINKHYPTNYLCGMKTLTLNIGLDRNDGGKNKLHWTILVTSNRFNIIDSKLAQSTTEETLVLNCEYSPEFVDRIHEICGLLKQDCIACVWPGGQELIGPNAQKWGTFNPEFFIKF